MLSFALLRARCSDGMLRHAEGCHCIFFSVLLHDEMPKDLLPYCRPANGRRPYILQQTVFKNELLIYKYPVQQLMILMICYKLMNTLYCMNTSHTLFDTQGFNSKICCNIYHLSYLWMWISSVPLTFYPFLTPQLNSGEKAQYVFDGRNMDALQALVQLLQYKLANTTVSLILNVI